MEEEKKGKKRWAQLSWTIACALWLGFIFGNSLRTGVESSAQSASVVEFVQKIFKRLFPNGWVANAVGEEYLRLHAFIRKAAHFAEYAVLGGLFCGCYRAYTPRLRFSFIPLLGLTLVPVLDEWLQTLVSGRAGAFSDVIIDVCGGFAGFGTVALAIYLIVKIRSKKERLWEKKA